MKLISSILLTAILSYAAGFWFPWWIIAVAAFVVAFFIQQSPFRSFLSGFIALFLVWFALASYLDYRNHHILSPKIAEILFKQSSSLLITAVTGLLAALVGGMAALSGATCRRLFPQN